MEEVVRRGVFRELGSHRFDKGEVIGNLCNIGKEIADPCPGLAMLFKSPGRLHDLSNVVELGRFKLPDCLSGVLAIELFE